MSRMSLCLVVGLLACAARSHEVGYVEDFTLSPNRGDTLTQLIPGSEDYYYYSCLNFQQTGAFDKVDEMVKLWIERHGRTQRVEEIVNRNALLSYEKEPKKSLDFLRWRLGLNYDHRKEIIDQKPNQPTRLDGNLISRETMTREALARYGNLQGFEDAALELLAQQQLTGEQRRELLGRLTRPDVANLVRLIIADLHFKYSSDFGSLGIHKQLTLAQLDELLKGMPELLNQTFFVTTYLTKLQPSPDVDRQLNAKERAAWFDRVWAYVSKLNPSHNSLKAHVLFHRLEFDREQGVYDKDRFMEYLKLPRPTAYMRPEYIDNAVRIAGGDDSHAYLNQDFSASTLMVVVNTDDELVRDYLLHFFQKEDAFAPYAVYIREDYLKDVFAESKIVNGLGDMEKWYSLLNNPTRYQQLKERVDLDFAPENNHYYAANDAVSLDVDVKNVKTLIVKVFELNTLNYYREKNREVDTSINLDGLVANDEKTYNYDEAPLRRVRRHFDFPTLKKPGVYVVEFIGNGTSSRALIHKGKLRFVERIGSAGHVFSVMDEENKAVKDASVWMGGQNYTANKDGEINIPFSTNPGKQTIVLRQGDFASFDTFDHKGENYALTVGFFVDRESLLKRKKATVLVRPALTLTGASATVNLLEDVALQISTTDHDGVGTTKEVPDFKLFDDKESVYEFQTPDNIVQIGFSLRARVKSLTQQKKLDLVASRSFGLNRIDLSEKIEALHLNHTSDGYFLQLLGKTGEAKADRPVALNFKHDEFKEPAHAVLQTGADGKIVLGALPGIRTITANLQDGQAYSWILPRDDHNYYATVHGNPAQVLHLPYMGAEKAPTRAEFSLLETRGGTFVADKFDALGLADGFIEIKALPAGDYSLLIKNLNEYITIRIADGDVRDGYVLGENRTLEIANPEPLQIATVDTNADTIKLQLKNVTKYTRVHVVADRFAPAYSIFSQLERTGLPEPESVVWTKMVSHYLTGRNIGDEYRYILERRYAPKFAGNMLNRPNLLLNPFTLRTTDTSMDDLNGQGSFGSRSGGGRRLTVTRHGGSRATETDSAAWADLDFLPDPATLLANLVPDKDGAVSIARKDLGDHQLVHIVAVDTQSTVVREVALPEVALKPLDLRLATGLDPAKHFTEQKEITLFDSGQTLVMDDITTSSLESFDTLRKVFGLYTTLSHDPRLTEFSFILEWPKMKDDEKRSAYSKYACHELNFFIYRKDTDFFKAVLLPYLKNKKDKTFMDHYLIGDDMTAYTQPWSYDRLNVVEQILLAHRVQAELDPAVRHAKEIYDLIPPDLERLNFLFKTALQGNALETADGVGFREATGKVVDANKRLEERDKRVAEAGDPAKNGLVPLGGAAGAPGNGPATPPPAPAVAVAQPAAPVKTAGMAGKPEALQKEMKQANEKSKDAAAKKADDAPVFDKGERADKQESQDAFVLNLDDRSTQKALYRKLDKTEELAENNYYKLSIEQQLGNLVTVNAFWKDFAANANKGPFVSSNLAEASHNFTEIMFAISVLDIPFEAGKHASEFADQKMTLNAKSPIVAYHKEIKESLAAEKTPLLVSQNFYRADDRYKFENNERFDKYVTDEFLVHVVYGCQIVLTNPTSSPQKLDLLLQIPRGAMPAVNGFYTKGPFLQLAPYSTTTFEYHFYFPLAGEFAHYPVHVARNGKMIASAPAVFLKAVEKLTKIDTESWDYISQNGSDEQVIAYLNVNNIHRLNLDRIAWRMSNAATFKQITALLTARHAYNNTLWSYAIVHNDAATIREYLQHADGFVAQSGLWLESGLLIIDPVARNFYQHLEYSPLVNARAHRLGKENKILNDRFYEQYLRTLEVLKYKPVLNDADRLSVACYMLLQDRVADGLAIFAKVAPDKIATKLQYDYVKAFADFYSDEHVTAREIAVAYKDYPIDRWKNRFADIVAQLDEAAGKSAVAIDKEDRTQAMGQLAAGEPSFEFKIDGKKVHVNFQNLAGAEVNYYPMDIELLFSSNPFVHDVNDQFSFVKPVKTEALKFPEKTREFEFEVPKEFVTSNVMIEITSAGVRKSQAYYANAMTVRIMENYGQVKVSNPKNETPMPKVYVKVYSKMKDGEVRFYKDGYTDLRGRFDYASLSTNELDNVEHFAVLVMSDTDGAIVREAAPPKR